MKVVQLAVEQPAVAEHPGDMHMLVKPIPFSIGSAGNGNG